MSRAMTTEFYDECIAAENRPVYFFQAQFGDTTLYLCNQSFDISWSGHTWLGNGYFHGYTNIQETEDLAIQSVEIHLTGVPSVLLALILSSNSQNRTGVIHFGFLDADLAVIASPIQRFKGKLDTLTIQEDPEAPVVTLRYESRLVELDRSHEARYTHEGQRAYYPLDQGFKYVAGLQERKLYWGNKKSTSLNPKR